MPLRFSPPGGASALALKSLVRGPSGLDGDDGAPGAAATIAAGTTTTGAEGSSASVSNSGSSSAAVFDFTIPRGAAPAVGYTFSTTTTDSDPGNGIVRFNHATPASITTIYFDNLDADGNTVTAWLDTFDDSTDTSHKGFLTFTDVASPSTKIGFDVTGSSVTDGTGYRKVTVTHSFGTTLFTNAHRLAVTFSRTGNKGTDGAGIGDMLAANNLSDLASKKTGYDNISIHGADVASASTIDLDDATGNLVDVTGTTTITAITLSEGRERVVRFTGALTLTNGASLVLPGGQSITTAAGDYAIFRGYAAGVVRCVDYIRKDGHPLIALGASIASASTTDLGSDISQSITITGTTTITSFGSSAASGAIKFCSFSGALVLTHNGTSLILPGAANITTAAGDCLIARYGSSGNWRVLTYLRAAGRPLNSGVSDTITKGFSVTAYNQSWASNFTVDPAQGNYQYATNDAARTITAPASDCAVDLLITNHASTAGAITFSGFTVGSSTGSTYATTGNNKYILSIRCINSVATYSWYALQ